MKAIYVIDCLIRNNDTNAQEQMGIIYGDSTKSTADVVNTFGRCHITWGNVLSETNYLYSYCKPLDTTMVKEADGENYDATLIDDGEQTIYLYKLS